MTEWHEVDYDDDGQPTADASLPEPGRSVEMMRVASAFRMVGTARVDADGNVFVDHDPSDCPRAAGEITLWRYA